MKNSPCIEAKDVIIQYNNGHIALDNVSFKLDQGTICALIGVNGSGKSTLFKTIMGLTKPKKGEVKICNLPIHQALKNNQVCYVPQIEEVDWQFPISVYDVVMQGRYGYMNFLRTPKEADHLIVNEAMQKVEISHLKDRQIGELSGGQKKRVFLARALAQQSKVMLLDEPFTGVDVKTENAIIDILKDLRKQDYLIFISTHNLGTVPEFCDQAIFLNRTVIAQGAIDKVFTQANLELVFGGILRHINIANSNNDETIKVLTDEESALVLYDDKLTKEQNK